MTTFSHIEVCGDIGDVQLRREKIPPHRPFLRINVAVDKRGANGRKAGTIWYECIIQHKALETPEKILKTLTIGRKVFVRGTPELRTFQKEDGTYCARTRVMVDGLPTLLDPKPKDHSDSG